MTQDQISKKTGIHYNFISAFVTGKMNPSRDELMTLRRVLGFTLTKVNAKKIEVLV
jgi:transcriptional regulator with XRE-family HTH domain